MRSRRAEVVPKVATQRDKILAEVASKVAKVVAKVVVKAVAEVTPKRVKVVTQPK